MVRYLLTTILVASLVAGASGGKGRSSMKKESSILSRPNPDVAKVLQLAPKAPALPKPTGPVVLVKDVEGLYNAVNSAKPGTTIFLADGVYKLPSEQLLIRTDRISLRGQSGDRENDRPSGETNHRSERRTCALWVQSHHLRMVPKSAPATGSPSPCLLVSLSPCFLR